MLTEKEGQKKKKNRIGQGPNIGVHQLLSPNPVPLSCLFSLVCSSNRTQSCLDATFGMVYEQLRQKAFCRGSTTGGGRRQHRGAAADTAGSEDVGGGQPAGPPSEPSEPTAPPSEPAGAATEPAATTSGDGGGLPAGVAAAHAAGGGGAVGFVAAAPAVAEREESAQVKRPSSFFM